MQIRPTLARRARALLAAALLAPAAAALAQSQDAGEEALVREITQRVLQEIERGGALDARIRAGIEDYVREQREARSRARAGQQARAAELARNVRPVDPARDHIRGNPDARIALIEYSDFECPFCKRFHATAMEALDAYPGELSWVYRHFPLAFHNPLAQMEAQASECAAALGGDDAFWRYADAIYARTRSNGDGFPLDGLVPLAVELGLDEAPFRDCLEQGRTAARVQEDYDEGVAIGISGTPGNVLLDRETGRVRVLPGAVPLAALRGAIDELLAQQ